MGLAYFHRSLGNLEALGSAPTLEKMALKWDLQSLNPASGTKQLPGNFQEGVEGNAHTLSLSTLTPQEEPAIAITSVSQVRTLKLRKEKAPSGRHIASEGQTKDLTTSYPCSFEAI